MIRALLVAICVCAAAPASAALSRDKLDAVALELPPHAAVPMSDRFSDRSGKTVTLAQAMAGRATLLVPVDYICPATCGPAAAIISAALTQTGLHPGQDYSLVFVGLRPNESRADREDFLTRHIGDDAQRRETRALTGDPKAIATLMRAIGYRYRKDEDTNSFAHPTGAVALAADGRVARVLSTVALDPNDLKLALVEASDGRIGSVFTRLKLLCYGFDPSRGIYTSRITQILRVFGVSTVLALGLAMVLFSARARSARSRS